MSSAEQIQTRVSVHWLGHPLHLCQMLWHLPAVETSQQVMMQKKVSGQGFPMVNEYWAQNHRVFLLHFVSSKRCRYVMGVTSKSPRVKVGSAVTIPNSELVLNVIDLALCSNDNGRIW